MITICLPKYLWGHKNDLRGLDAGSVVQPTGVKLCYFFCSGIQLYELLSPYLCFISFVYLDLYVLGDHSWIS